MNPLHIELTKLIGSKELSFGCLFIDNEKDLNLIGDGELNLKDITYHTGGWEEGTTYAIIEIIGHPATETDLKRWMNDKNIVWSQGKKYLFIDKEKDIRTMYEILYDSSKDLLDQEESTLEQIISLIKSNIGK